MMSQAYAATGALGQAITLLNEAIFKLKSVKTEVFSSLQYKSIPRQEFVEESRRLLADFIKRAPHILERKRLDSLSDSEAPIKTETKTDEGLSSSSKEEVPHERQATVPDEGDDHHSGE